MRILIRNTILLLFLLFNSFCSSNKNIKPNPDIEIYELCPSCNGYGVIESLSSAPSIKGIELSKNEKETATFCADITGGGWCFFSIFNSLRWGKNQGLADTEQDMEYKNKIQESLKNDPTGEIERPYIKRTVVCPRCKGIGWIKKSHDPDSETDRNKYFDAIRNFNEMNNK